MGRRGEEIKYSRHNFVVEGKDSRFPLSLSDLGHLVRFLRVTQDGAQEGRDEQQLLAVAQLHHLELLVKQLRRFAQVL